jgi:trimeric autotransporter adhesin
MSIMQALYRRHSTLSSHAFLHLVSAALLLLLTPASLSAQRTAIAARVLTNANTDSGSVPASQPITLTLRLAPTPDRAAALDQLLTSQVTPASPSYHHWLTPQQYAASYGATDDQLTALTTWAQSQGLTIAAVSAAKTRLILSGSVDQIQRAFSTTLRNYLVTANGSAQPRFAATAPTVPMAIAPMISSISGLDSLPPAISAKVLATSTLGLTSSLSTADSDPYSDAASAIDANAAPILTLNTTACDSSSLAQSDLDAYRALLRQANAQGITVLATNTCTTADGSASQPNSLLALPEITAITTAAEPSDTSLQLIDARPAWQVAPGLPDDGLRHQPDLTTASSTAFTQTIAKILTTSDGRQGNINSNLYSLATSPGLYTQPDNAPAGTWESATGLGTVDLTVLAKVFPRATGTNSTTTALVSSSYGMNYGQQFTLTATVLPVTSATQPPSGTVTFSASSQGTIGTATVGANGVATLNVTMPLNVGTYNLTATYAGDSNYSGSASTSSVIVTVSIVNATLSATIAPTTNVPYGSTATITATVALPGSNAAPSGTVTAVVEGVTGASGSATLTPNPGGNTATANININAPTPQTSAYTVSVTCAGTQNFQCQTPATPTFTTAKGNTSTTISLTPAAPQAGQPVTITATVNNNGNGTGVYTFSGNVTFTDSTTGKTLATVPVGTNQAATSQTLSGNVQHNIIATYSGDANWNGSASTPAQVTPTLLPSTLTITSNTTSALVGVNIVITATVFTTAANTVGPTGTVSFYDTFNNSIVQLNGSGGAITLTPNGPNQSIARFTTIGLLAGGHSIYAVYSGDANFAPATSSTMPLNITDFNVIMVPQSLTLKAGQTGQVVMLIGLVNGFNGSVSFGCTPPAGAEATCSFSPASLQGGGSTTMKVVTTAAQVSPTPSARNSSHGSPWSLGAGSAFAALLCFALPRRRRALPLLFSSLLALSLIPSLGCGLGGNAPTDAANSTSSTTPSDPGTPLGTQMFTITAAGNDEVNTARHDYQYQVTVQ